LPPSADQLTPAEGSAHRERLLTTSLLGDLQTIGPLGVVLHSCESIRRDPGEDL
jgi:hypothetical protein